MKGVGYSLWLVPERNSEEFHLLRKLIDKLAHRYRTPAFDPHVTLLGKIHDSKRDAVKKTRDIAAMLSPFEIALGKIGSNGAYFQMLFSEIEQTPALMAANVALQKMFGMNGKDFFPHLSLAYGNLSDARIAVLQKSAEQENPIAGMHFSVHAVELWHTDGAVEDWQKVGEFPFKQP